MNLIPALMAILVVLRYQPALRQLPRDQQVPH